MVYLCGQSHAPARQQTLLCHGGHHAELAAVHERCEVLHLLGQGWLFEVLADVGVGGLAARFCVGERHLVGVAGGGCEGSVVQHWPCQ